MDRFVVRSAVLRALRARVPEMYGELLDIGCGYMPYKELVLAAPSKVERYIGLDLPPNETYTKTPDIIWDGKTIPLRACAVDWTMATEVLEHCPDPQDVLEEVSRVLKPGGGLFLTVPFLWPLHDVPYDEFRYTPFSLRRFLFEAGFVDVRLEALGGWDASLAQLLGLWVRRRPMTTWKRQSLSMLLKPMMWFLLKKDKLPSLTESTMITGISGVARKAQ